MFQYTFISRAGAACMCEPWCGPTALNCVYEFGYWLAIYSHIVFCGLGVTEPQTDSKSRCVKCVTNIRCQDQYDRLDGSPWHTYMIVFKHLTEFSKTVKICKIQQLFMIIAYKISSCINWWVCVCGSMESVRRIFAGNESDTLTFNTLSGRLIAKKIQDMISIDLPVNPPLPFVSNRVRLCFHCYNTALRSVTKYLLFCK